MVQVKNLFCFFNPGLNGLPAVVTGEPARQISSHRVNTEMKQGAVLEGLAGVKAFQRHIQGVGTL